MTDEQNEEYIQHIRTAHEALSKAVLLLPKDSSCVSGLSAFGDGYMLARLDLALDILEMELPEVQQATELSLVEGVTERHWRGDVKIGPV